MIIDYFPQISLLIKVFPLSRLHVDGGGGGGGGGGNDIAVGAVSNLFRSFWLKIVQ